MGNNHNHTGLVKAASELAAVKREIQDYNRGLQLLYSEQEARQSAHRREFLQAAEIKLLSIDNFEPAKVALPTLQIPPRYTGRLELLDREFDNGNAKLFEAIISESGVVSRGKEITPDLSLYGTEFLTRMDRLQRAWKDGSIDIGELLNKEIEGKERRIVAPIRGYAIALNLLGVRKPYSRLPTEMELSTLLVASYGLLD